MVIQMALLPPRIYHKMQLVFTCYEEGTLKGRVMEGIMHSKLLSYTRSVADLGGGGQGGQLHPPFSSPPFSFLLVVCVVSVTVHTTPALYGARRSPPKYVAQKARASPVGESPTPATTVYVHETYAINTRARACVRVYTRTV